MDHLQLDRCIVCGDTDFDLHITAPDALFALKSAVGIKSCLFCICDTDDGESITAVDALAILQKAVGLDVLLHCPPCVF